MKAAFPHMGNYYIPFSLIVRKLLDMEVVEIPKITKKTVEIGSKNSPDFVCAPYKFNLGNYMEALDMGAELLIQAGGGCRFGYYGELQENTLRELGYNFEFLNLSEFENFYDIYKQFKKYNNKLNIFKVLYYAKLCIKITKYIDVVENYIRRNNCFTKDNSMNLLHDKFLNELKTVENFKPAKKVFKKYYKQIKNVKLHNVDNPLQILIVGELYTLMESFSNHEIESMLHKYGVSVIRYVDMSYLIFENKQSNKRTMKNTSSYLKYYLGAGGTDSVSKSLKHVHDVDGIIHMKSFGCTPEINAMPILENISNDYKIPIIYLSFDTSTSDTGVITRIEAFVDMLKMKKRNTNIMG